MTYYQLKPVKVRIEKFKKGMESGIKDVTREEKCGYEGSCSRFVKEKYYYINTKSGQKLIYGDSYVITFPNGDRNVLPENYIKKYFEQIDENLDDIFYPKKIEAKDIWRCSEKTGEEPIENAPHLTQPIYTFTCPICKNEIKTAISVTLNKFENDSIRHLRKCIDKREGEFYADDGLFK